MVTKLNLKMEVSNYTSQWKMAKISIMIMTGITGVK